MIDRLSRSVVLRRAVASTALAGALAMLPHAARAQIVPTGATPVSGTVSVGTPTANANGGLDLTITQGSARAVLTWNSFSVGALDRVTFNQRDAAAATLNRVTGSTGSTIAGQINANGSVYLVNPNGIVITSSGQVQTGGGFVASTLNISNDDFNAGTNRFAGSGSSANVGNAGTISASGIVALLGGTVTHSGTITVQAGRVAIGAGEQMTLDVNGGLFLQVTTPTNAVTAGGTALIQAGGSIVVQQNSFTDTVIQLSAATAANAVRNAVNLTGSLSVTSATGGSGRILLQGGDGGAVNVTGSIASRGTAFSGAITMTGDRIDLGGANLSVAALDGGADGGFIDVTGSAVTANGSLSSAVDTARAMYLYATRAGSGDGAVRITAPIVSSGTGELVYIARTDIAMAGVTARNVRLSMNAGNDVAYAGSVGSSGAIDVGLFNLDNGVWRQLGTLPAFRATDFRFTQTDARFLRATGGDGSFSNPYVVADVYGLQGIGSSDTLTSAFRLGGDIDATGTANWNAGAGFVPIGQNIAFIGGLSGANGAAGGARYAIDGLTINAATPGGLFRSVSSRISDLNLTNASITTPGNGGGVLTGTLFAAGEISNVDVSGTRTGGADLGGLVGTNFGAISDVRSSVTVNGGTAGNVGGLVGTMGNGSITRGTASGAVSGLDGIGGLVGQISAGTIANSSASGTVDGRATLGGLIGQLSGSASVTASSASGNVTGTTAGAFNIGGLIGAVSRSVSGTTAVTNSSASGIVNGASNVGGLIGGVLLQGGGSVNVTGGVATGRVIGDASTTGLVIGGLIGRIDSDNGGNGGSVTIVSSYATGNVSTASTATTTYVGGLIGSAARVAVTDRTTYTIRDSYATGSVTSSGAAVGGLLGYADNFKLTIADSYASGAVQGGRDVGGLAGYLATIDATISDTRTSGPATASGAVSGATNVGGLIGGMVGGTLSGVRATGTVQGGSNVGGLVGSVISNAPVEIRTSSATGSITGTGTGVGGLVGLFQRRTPDGNFLIADSFATGAVQAASIVGGLVGWQISQAGGENQIARSYATGSVTATTATTTGAAYAGGLVGLVQVPGTTTVPFTAIDIRSSFATGEVSADATTSTVSRVGGLIGGILMPASDRFYVRLADVAASGAVRSGGGQVGGLVGSMSGLVTNTFLDSGHASGSVSGSVNVGGLVGSLANAALYAAYSTGAVTGRGGNVGGLVGGQFTGAQVSHSFASGTVRSTGTGDTGVGGLIGTMGNGSTILRESYASGAVSSAGGTVGGLVGAVASGTISNVYATGAATGTDTVGGLVGLLSSGASVSGAWSSGAVASGDATRGGGLVGLLGGTLGNAYWDRYSTGQAAAVGSASSATPATTVASVTSDPATAGGATAYRATSYANLPGARDIGSSQVSGFVFLPGGTRPFLAYEVPSFGNPMSDLSSDPLNPFDGATILRNAHQLQLINYDADTLATSYELAGNIDLAETGAATPGNPGSYAGMWAPTGFVPLGSDGAGRLWDGTSYVQVGYADIGRQGVATGYAGVFDGAGVTLSNLSINRPGVQNVGLFGGASGIIVDLTLSGNVTGYVSTGGLVGVQQGGGIGGVTSAVNVTGSSGAAYVGGLVGFSSNATITASTASGTVSADGAAGGLVGLLYRANIVNSSASGIVSGRAGRTGGLVGIVEGGTVTGSTSTSTVNGVSGARGYGVLRDGGTYNGDDGTGR